ncbi:MAG: hypothetical protein EXS46_03670 [Candidatus Taylorbacteria bacterium]|nr:hypothetical protein [Candidatus Taylorbacteria bacterium]
MNNILPIILLVASIGIFTSYINPTYTGDTGAVDNSFKSVKELQSIKRDYDDALGRVSEIKKTKDDLETKFNSVKKEDKDKMSKLLPSNIDSVRLIIDINNIAQEKGMSLTNILLTAPGIIGTAGSQSKVAPAVAGQGTSATPAPTPVQTGIVGPDNRLYESVKLGFSVTGTYENFKEFLKRLENSLRIVDVVSLSFTSSLASKMSDDKIATSSQSSFEPVFTYLVTIKTYYLK